MKITTDTGSTTIPFALFNGISTPYGLFTPRI